MSPQIQIRLFIRPVVELVAATIVFLVITGASVACMPATPVAGSERPLLFPVLYAFSLVLVSVAVNRKVLAVGGLLLFTFSCYAYHDQVLDGERERSAWRLESMLEDTNLSADERRAVRDAWYGADRRVEPERKRNQN